LKHADRSGGVSTPEQVVVDDCECTIGLRRDLDSHFLAAVVN
jgi:hypothetical protein